MTIMAGPVYGPFADEIGAGEECTEVACGKGCAWDTEEADFIASYTVHYRDMGDVDGEGPCRCPHHEEYREALRR